MAAVTQIPLTLRLQKGSALTYEETDENFTNLRDAILDMAAQFNASRFVFGEAPAPDERDGVLWLPYGSTVKPDLSGFFVWISNDWVRVKEPVLHGTTTGTANAYKLTIPDYVSQLSDLTGRVITAKIHTVNTADPTLAVTGLNGMELAATEIRKGGNQSLVGQEMPTNSIAVFVFDGSHFQLVSDVPKGVDPEETSFYSYISPDVAIPTSGGVARFVHGLVHNGLPIAPSLIRITLVRVADGQQTFSDGKWVVAKGDEIEATCVMAGRRGSDNEWMAPAFRWSSNSEEINVNALYPPSTSGEKGLGIIETYFNPSGGVGDQVAPISDDNIIDPEEYRLRVYASAFNPELLTSTSATVSVGAGVSAPVIGDQPDPASVTEGQPASFTVVATGQNLSYQWFKDGVSIAGADEDTYEINTTELADAGDYTVIVSNNGGAVVSDPATLTVTPI